MKILGILAEYNPFHAGHAFLLQEAKARSGADFCVVAMSGSYVQRGEPAVRPVRERVQRALQGGADLVVELPVHCVLQSAEQYAYAGMKLLCDCGCNIISFGMECASAFIELEKIAGILLEEPEPYKAALRNGQKQGLSFPAAVEAALAPYADSALLRTPNHILAVEYIKALRRIYADIPYRMPQLLPVQRIRTASASELRKKMKNGITKDDFSLLLHEKLIDYRSDGSDAGDRIRALAGSYTGFTAFCDLLKVRSRTYTSISRMLMRLTLGLSDEPATAGYISVLGFCADSTDLISLLKEHAPIPVLINLPKDLEQLKDRHAYDEAFHALRLYNCVITNKTGDPVIHPYSEPVLKL